MVSKQRRKQRLSLYAAPLHRRHRYLSAPLSPELRKKHGVRSLPVRKGDKVRIVCGDFKKLEGDVLDVNAKRRYIHVGGATTTKTDGTQVPRPVAPSNVTLIKLAPDKERDKVLERRSKIGKEGAK
jgi:large subunit ribosomal protein L24